MIDEEVLDGTRGIGPSRAMGDNCPGYPMLRIVEQGYDVK